jgi:hypothetical protein
MSTRSIAGRGNASSVSPEPRAHAVQFRIGRAICCRPGCVEAGGVYIILVEPKLRGPMNVTQLPKPGPLRARAFRLSRPELLTSDELHTIDAAIRPGLPLSQWKGPAHSVSRRTHSQTSSAEGPAPGIDSPYGRSGMRDAQYKGSRALCAFATMSMPCSSTR